MRNLVQGLPSESFKNIALDEEMQTLANAYIEAGALGRASEFDALHVAVATVARADLLLSWNFKRMVNYDRIRKFNAVNLMNGYPAVDIRSPREMEHGDDDQGV